ncbi:hypothetical protein MPPM_5416 (plasmid) [Methylorubrum populi]|jgi:hypothetical protein|uniref:Uncharacterized protein n=1 Tax=Methylorubrum populi TaxID=223967 RepID=A0A160PNC1_9HYPH|nr:hypothetical protein [Methylorubrum populi]OAH27956.1 hypothetical protein AX289_29045 [Methylorubrum populi]BAU94021.1 hypothetical protein MPPM_5416 [Methylorubrum populi]
MQFPTAITQAGILRDQERPGFTETYHRVVFAIDHDGLDDMEVAVWVHPTYPEDQLVPVARAILAGRLASMAEAASEGAMTPDEVDALWQRVKPATIEGEPA